MSRQASAKRPRAIGPFFIIMLIISIGLLAWRHYVLSSVHTQPEGHPVVEHHVITGTGALALAVPPPDMILRHAKELKLSAAQHKQLAALASAYQRDLEPLNQQMQRARASYLQYQQSVAHWRRVPGSEITKHMQEISALSGQMATLRTDYWNRLSPLLTATQRKQARTLWRKSLSGKAM